MEIKHTNYSDIEISSSQTSGLRTFNRVQVESGKVKVKETYTNQELVEITYFIENENEIVNRYSNKPKFWLILSKRQTYGNYVAEESSLYKDGELLEKYKRLFIKSEDYFLLAKANSSYLCHQPLDLNNNQPILSETDKQYYYHDQEEDGFIPHFEADYDEDGNISIITHYDVYDIDDHKGGRTIYGAEDAAKFRFLLPENPDYFLDATFEPF